MNTQQGTPLAIHVAGRLPRKALASPLTRHQRTMRSWYFQALMVAHASSERFLEPLTWRDARNMWKGATIAVHLLSINNNHAKGMN